MLRYNDYELIYLIQSESCEQALELMFKKYKYLIYKFLNLYNVNEIFFEDYVQECNILMYNIICKFDEKKGKTFTRFYEFVLRRKIWGFKRSESKHENFEDLSYIKDESIVDEELNMENLTPLEQNVYKRYYAQNQKIAFIAKMEEKSTKQIYNAIYRIKQKYKNNML